MRLVPRDGVTFQTTDHGGIVLDTAAGRLFGLNPAAAVAWSALAGGGNLDDAIAAVLARFDVDDTTARADVQQLLDVARERGLLVVP